MYGRMGEGRDGRGDGWERGWMGEGMDGKGWMGEGMNGRGNGWERGGMGEGMDGRGEGWERVWSRIAITCCLHSSFLQHIWTHPTAYQCP